jgi:hypothetical protein
VEEEGKNALDHLPDRLEEVADSGCDTHFDLLLWCFGVRVFWLG